MALLWLLVQGRAATERATSKEPAPLRWTNSNPLAFVRGNNIRIYFTNENLAFDGKWELRRIEAQEFAYAGVTLKADDSPPALPSQESRSEWNVPSDPFPAPARTATPHPRLEGDLSSSGWREVKTVGMGESQRLVGAAAARLAPTNGHGIYFQYSAGDGVLLRDAQGNAKVVGLEQKPADLVIDRRYSRQELASVVAAAIESDLRSAYPNDKQFLLMRMGGHPGMSLLDFERRHTISLLVPRAGRDSERPVLGTKLKPLAGFVLLDHGWSFLKNPISSTTRTLHQAVQWTGSFFEPKLRKRGSTIPAITNAPGMDLAEWETWLDNHCGTPRERGAIQLFVNGEEYFPHLERRIAEAQGRIDVHICIFDRDDVAVQVADWLKARSTNVGVKVIFDRLNSRGAGNSPPATPMPAEFVPPESPGSYLRSGSRVQVRPQLNPGFSCDHSKILIFDGRYAHIGGMNFGREYRYEWHDLMAEVEGPVVASFQRQFDKKWAQTGGWGDCGLAAQSLCGAKTATTNSETSEASAFIELRRLYTRTFDRQIRCAQLAAINRARSHIILENAYLYSNDVIVALARARLRGVDVRVIQPAENDFDAGHRSNLVTGNYLRQHGVRVYLYPGMSHVKALLVDGWLCFGSANFDALSLRLNREANLATSDPGFVGLFQRRVFDVDLARSRELTSDVPVDFRDHLLDALLTPL